ncbi:uncharacterized protein IL334_005956 [Kwoniella shivajii]|uniref:NADP-dependent oxidoreductase domain-containing protein n=1 Tax=Kwoniella shivajii TaxID=564305 RepID=A0ABZ1D6M7_9TREE|nr:hypothetical protein IL334_005956 [Kwoniella shivajii]
MSKLTLQSTLKLHTGTSIPLLGYGVFQAKGDDCYKGIIEALKVGYRHIDDAQGYYNEEDAGRAIADTDIPREKIFVTTKYMPTKTVVPSSQVYDELKKSLPKLDNTKNGYIDLMLIHAPFGGPEGRASNWEALVKAQKEGWIKDIGVSNFGVRHLKELPSPKPTINQIEVHPWCQQKEIIKYCQENDIAVEAYCPIVRADPKRFAEPKLKKISEKHGKGPGEVLLRWSLQKGLIPLIKSVTPSRIKSNTELYDFELDDQDIADLDSLDEGAGGAISWNPVNDP